MKNKQKNQLDTVISGIKPTTQDLKGRQSVRATFRLSEACIMAISILSAQLSIKQKSVFDHLLEDVQVLESIARELEGKDFERDGRIQKTFVVSRKSLFFLDTISRSHNAPRDAVVERSVLRLLPIITLESEKHERRKKLFAEISDNFVKGKSLLSEIENLLSKEDPLYTKFEAVISGYESTLNSIATFIEKGKIIEKFQRNMNDEKLPKYK